MQEVKMQEIDTLAVTTEAKREAVERMCITYPRLKRASDAIDQCRIRSHHAAEPYCLLIHGPSGAGKTTLIESYVQAHPPSFSEEGKAVQVLCATIPVPATMMTMAVALLAALGDPFAEKGTLNNKTRRLIRLLKECGVEIIILDEFQHFMDRDGDKVLRTVADWLKNLINLSKLPVILCGLPECHKVLEANEQLHRRFSAQETLKPFSWQGDGKIEFCRFLRSIDQNLPFAEPSGLGEESLAHDIFSASGGLVANIMKIVRGAAHIAIDQGAPRIERAMLAQAFDERILSSTVNRANPLLGGQVVSKNKGVSNRIRPVEPTESVSAILSGRS